MNHSIRTMTAAAGCLILILLAAGCAVLSPLTARKQPLEERINGYMQAQVDRKWDQAYLFFDAASREQVSRETYISQPRKMSFTGFRIEEINESKDRATVKVRIDLSFMGFEFKGDKGGPQTQEWVKEKGSWFVKAPQTAPVTPMDKPPVTTPDQPPAEDKKR